MKNIELRTGTWRKGELIGGGHFGKVYSGISPSGEPAALKIVPLERKAARELDVWQTVSGLPSIIPLQDYGEWDGNYVLAMPKADCDLRSYLHEQGGRLAIDEAKSVLFDIAEALVAISEREQQGQPVVHRDLKPENVLKWNGCWCVADFGIARYADQTTAVDTLKPYRSWPYAAPELWNEERAEPRTDVYALGVVAYELLAGQRPFPGPTADRYKAQHLTDVPPALDAAAIGPEFAGLIEWCLRKDPLSRPHPADVRSRLHPASLSSRPGESDALHRANRAANRERTEREAEEAQRHIQFEASERRRGDATRAFESVIDALWRELTHSAPALVEARHPDWRRDRRGTFLINQPKVNVLVSPISYPDTSEWGDRAPQPEVVARSGIRIGTPLDTPVGRHGGYFALLYCDAEQPNTFRWYETSFRRTGVVILRDLWDDPPEIDDHGLAAALGGGSGYAMASPLRPIDAGDTPDFVRRWADLIGAAFDGVLPPV